MELWYFGMSSAGSQYMDQLEGRGDEADNTPPPPPRRTSCSLVSCVLQSVNFSDLFKESLLTGQEGLILPHPLPLLGEVENPPSSSASINCLHHLTPSVLLCSRWFHLTLAQWLCLRPASLGRPFMCCCRVSVVQLRLQRTVLVVAGCAGLAAAVGVVV